LDGERANYERTIRSLLAPGEELRHEATAGQAVLAVTSHRVAVIHAERLAMALEIEQLRRIQFDIEKARPATLVLVPEYPDHAPEVLTVAPEEYEEVAAALVAIGKRLAPLA
jgi:hypothetical protein